MIGLPWDFILIGVLILAPETLWWFFVTRPREARIKRLQRQTALFWRIRDLEMDIYGEWQS